MGRVPQPVRALFDAILVMEKLTKSKICNNRLRQIHLVDIDNLTGGPTKDPFIHRQVREWYDFHSDRQERDLCFVAVSHYSAFSATKAWAGAKIIWASGVDGADLALIRIVEETSFLNRELINKVNEFSKKGKADYTTFDTGVPNFDALDIRIASRTLLDEKIETVSLETINFLEEEFVEDGEKEIFYNIVNDFDIAFAPYKVNKEELKKEHGELDSNKIATDLSQVKKILDKVA